MWRCREWRVLREPSLYDGRGRQQLHRICFRDGRGVVIKLPENYLKG